MKGPFAMTYFQGAKCSCQGGYTATALQKEFLNLDTPLKTNGGLMVAYHGRK